MALCNLADTASRQEFYNNMQIRLDRTRNNLGKAHLKTLLLWTVVLLVVAGKLCDAQTRPFLFEQEIAWPSASYANPLEQVALTMVFTSPSRRVVQVGGF